MRKSVRIAALVLIAVISLPQTLFAAMGPLDTYSTNDPKNRWFKNTSTGKGVYMTGSNNWNVLISHPGSGTSYNYIDYLNFMQERGHNSLRLRTNPDSNLASGASSRFQRSGQCCALDGGNKWDLTKWNQAHFDKMQDIVEDAQARGIYVGILFYDGWWIKQGDQADANNRWSRHPFNPTNNIHTQTSGTTMTNIHTLSAPNYVLTRQKDYITKVIQTVDSYDNVFYEIVNEDLDGTMQWQEDLAAHTRSLTNKPVGITARTSDNNDELFNSSADWIAPDHYDAENYRTNPPSSNKNKVVISDTDHLWGIGGDAFWVWRTFTRGLNPVFMDPYTRTGGAYETFDTWESLRWAMGDTLSYANRIPDFAVMQPRQDLCSTNYCLVDPGNHYIVYSHPDSDFTLNMVAGTYKHEWFNIISRDKSIPNPNTITVGNGNRIFNPPTNRAVLFLEKTSSTGATSTPTTTVSNPTNTPKPTNTPVLGIVHDIPGFVQAEDFSAMNGVNIGGTQDTGGGFHLGNIQKGD